MMMQDPLILFLQLYPCQSILTMVLYILQLLKLKTTCNLSTKLQFIDNNDGAKRNDNANLTPADTSDPQSSPPPSTLLLNTPMTST